LLNSLKKTSLELAIDLMRYPSITPNEAGCLTDLHGLLEKEGFDSHLVVFQDTTNLYARFGTGGPHLCFAGHVDVVPPGPESLWSFPPFEPTCHNGFLYGRGVADMKGAIACFLSAVFSFNKAPFDGSISLLLTSDEEGTGVNGIMKMIPWLQERQQVPHVILIGEPTGQQVGTVLQVGRRGSLTGHLRFTGTQGHIAYPHLADNPLPRLISCLQKLIDLPLDQGDDFFEASRLEVTSVDTDNPTVNIIPGSAEARFGIRFNPHQNVLGLSEKVEQICNDVGGTHELALRHSGNPFLTQDAHWIGCVHHALKEVMHAEPRHTTQGGTTDGRFLCRIAPVLEVGLPETTIHQIDERVAIEDIEVLERLYHSILTHYFHPCS